MSVNLAIIYYSATGTNYRLARAAEEGAKAAGAEVRVLRVPELAPESAINGNPAWKAHLDETKNVPEVQHSDIEWADAIIFSSPTRYGNIAGQMKQFLDTTGGLWFHGKTVNKVVSAMSSASNDHGGQEATILALYTSMYHWGAIVVAPGYTDPVLFEAGGNPYGVSATINDHTQLNDKILNAAKHQAARVVTVAGWVKKGKSSS